jgi:transposase
VNLPENLPADIKQYILDLAYKHNALEETNANLVKENTSLTQDKQSLAKENEIKQNKILKLESIIFDFNRKIFGHKSEKIDPHDLYYGVLFNEGEKGLHDEDKLLAGHSETIHVKSFNRKKAGRKPLPENIPREEIFHDIAESEKTCNSSP